MIDRAYYGKEIQQFLQESVNEILGTITAKSGSAQVTVQQRNAWKEEIKILQEQLDGICGRIFFEYTIPRKGERADIVILFQNIIFLLEFKCGENKYVREAKNQVCNYALDLRDFHQESHNKLIVPILVATGAPSSEVLIQNRDCVLEPISCNANSIKDAILTIVRNYPNEKEFDYSVWQNSPYSPTPTIIEAAQALYNHHHVEEITRSDAGAINISKTTEKINAVIEESKKNGQKSICFVTGVPGAGKTLVGLNLAIQHTNSRDGEHAVFLSGNFPLVQVLQEALVRDKILREKENGIKVKKTDAAREASSFIQIIHHYRDEYVGNDRVPPERVAIFDEAQRAWTLEQISQFMRTKKGVQDFDQSEPEFLIQTMDRHSDWAVIVCLVGGGQEINTGEAGLPEWFDSLRRSFPHWHIYLPPELNEPEYLRERSWEEMTSGFSLHKSAELHLASSIRSYRAKEVASFINFLLDGNRAEAEETFNLFKEKYPIVLTRDLVCAKKWLRSQARGTARYGLLASSGALRLKREGIFVKNKISVVDWFLDSAEDVRSSYFLEDAVTEFDIQGLELDYALVVWDADLRYNGSGWSYWTFKGTKWNNLRNPEKRLYLKNAYRVLLTRARQGMVIFLPKGNQEDPTAVPEMYDKTYEYLRSLRIPEI